MSHVFCRPANYVYLSDCQARLEHCIYQRKEVGRCEPTLLLLFTTITITTHHASWRIGQQRSASTPCLSLASLWVVPQLWFVSLISASTVLRQVVFGRPRFRCPSGVQWIATSVMELASLRSTCPIQHHRFLVMMVSVSSCWHRMGYGWRWF